MKPIRIAKNHVLAASFLAFLAICCGCTPENEKTPPKRLDVSETAPSASTQPEATTAPKPILAPADKQVDLPTPRKESETNSESKPQPKSEMTKPQADVEGPPSDLPTDKSASKPVTAKEEDASVPVATEPAAAKAADKVGEQVDDTEKPASDAQPVKPRDLGPPLVDDPKPLVQLGKYQAWVDPKAKQIVLVGETCKADYPLEFFITSRSRAYESVLVIDGEHPTPGGLTVFEEFHKALILIGAQPGHPAMYDDAKKEMILATGTPISIDVRWKGKDGKVRTSSAKQWIRDIKTKKVLEKDWVFAGSRFSEKYYAGNGGDFVCVLNNPNAILDLPIRSEGAIESRSFEAFTDRLPPAGTPVTIVFKPKLDPKSPAPATK